jgi:hypothetical protein
MSKKNPFADLDALRAQGDADVQEFQRHEQELRRNGAASDSSKYRLKSPGRSPE